jgi:hypothetical protein
MGNVEGEKSLGVPRSAASTDCGAQTGTVRATPMDDNILSTTKSVSDRIDLA